MKVEFSGEITKCHQHLHRILSELGFQVRDNAQYSQYKIDCMTELENIGFEANGELYHKWKKRDNERDIELLKNHGIEIIRIPEKLLDGKHDPEVKEIILESINANNKYTFADKG